MKNRIGGLASAVVILGLGVATARAQTAIGIDSGVDTMYSINLATGATTLIGGVGFGDVEGISFQPGTGVLFGVDDSTNVLVTCNTATGACTSVGSLGVDVFNPGLAFTCGGTLYMASQEDDPEVNALYTVNTATGAATLVGSLGAGFEGQSLAYSPTASGCASGMWVLDGDDDPPTLGCVNLTTGAVTVIGSIGISLSGQPAIEFDTSGVLWVVEEGDPGDIAQINPVTGAATDVGYDISGASVDALAIANQCQPQENVPVLGTAGLMGLASLVGLAGLAAILHRRQSM